MRITLKLIALTLALLSPLAGRCDAGLPPATGTRVKDVAAVIGSGRHKLVGYGLVTGLEGSGDSDRAAVASHALANMLNQFGLTIEAREFQVRNVAAVIVTAELPAIAQPGVTLDVTVSPIGDAQSLQGGILLVTPLKAADSQVYALAQGAISIGGFNVSGGLDKAQKNHPTVGRVPNGASVTQAIAPVAGAADSVSLALYQPDYTTACNVARAINDELGGLAAEALNASCITVQIPQADRPHLPRFLSRLESTLVEPDTPARVVINERTGTVVIGSRVRISPVAISHGSLSIEVEGQYQVSQPGPQIKGQAQTVVVPQQEMRVQEHGGPLVAVPQQATLQDLVAALNALGVKPRDLIAIIQALKEAGALQAELVIL